jgi:hypothetical protein
MSHPSLCWKSSNASTAFGAFVAPFVCQTLLAEGVPWRFFYIGSLAFSGLNTAFVAYAYWPTNEELCEEERMHVQSMQDCSSTLNSPAESSSPATFDDEKLSKASSLEASGTSNSGKSANLYELQTCLNDETSPRFGLNYFIRICLGLLLLCLGLLWKRNNNTRICEYTSSIVHFANELTFIRRWQPICLLLGYVTIYDKKCGSLILFIHSMRIRKRRDTLPVDSGPVWL